MTTFLQMQTRVSTEVGSLSLSDADELALIKRWINEGYERVLIDTRCNVDESSSVITVVAGTDDYSLPTSVLAILEVISSESSQESPMERATPAEIFRMRRANAQQAGSTYSYALNGADRFMVYPQPGSGTTFTFLYVPRPTALSADGDSPSDVPAEFHPLIELWAMSQAGSWADDRTSDQGRRYTDLYDRELSRMVRSLRRKAGRQGGVATVGYGRSIIPNDNSADWR